MTGLAGTVAIGDLQGCFGCFDELRAAIDQTFVSGEQRLPPKLWFSGDLVNRGPESLETLRWVYRQRHRLVTVLGNHDLHLLAVAAGARRLSRNDTFGTILSAPDRDELLDWLRRQPLAHFESGHLLVHAGVLPQWSTQQTLALAREVEQQLAGSGWQTFLREMYGDKPDRWDNSLGGVERLRVIINAMTRLRFCTADGRMEFDSKEGSGSAPRGYLPWFDVPQRASADTTVIFGHWSTLGLLMRPNLLGLDTGCVWGGALTAVRLSDRARLQVSCPQAAKPKPG